jgi:hypothetical protein
MYSKVATVEWRHDLVFFVNILFSIESSFLYYDIWCDRDF